MLLKDNSAALRNLSALVDFSNLINSSLEIDFILNNIILTFFGKLQTTRGLIALVNNNAVLELKAFKGINKDDAAKLPEIPIKDFDEEKSYAEFMRENRFVICKKIETLSGVKGVLLLGEKFTKQPYSEDDFEFLSTLVNIGATSIENSLTVDELKSVNRNLDSKVNQLSSLFDLGKEFSGILEKNRVTKLLTYSIIGQLFVTKYAVISCANGNCDLLENKFDNEKLNNILSNFEPAKIKENMNFERVKAEYPELASLGIELIIPMLIKGETKGLIFIGKRRTGQPFNNSDIEFAASVGSLAIISIENARLFNEALEKERLEKDLELARTIQNNLLPDKIPRLNRFEIAAYNQSARQVGGDYYDVIKLPDGRTIVAIADVSGKGVQAALLMANLQAFLHSICKQNIDIAEASNMVNDLVSENTIDGRFITFFWAALDDKTGALEYVNAGHNPPLLVRNGELIKLKTGGMILGVIQTMIPYKSERIQLEKGDMLILFTDGVTEAMNTEFNEFSDEKLEELASNIGTKDAQSAINEIIGEVRHFTIGAEQSDDITALVIKAI